MTAIQIQHPRWEVRCDRERCGKVFRLPEGARGDSSDDGVRSAAREAGWQVRPAGGPGSRKDPDLCPQHGVPLDTIKDLTKYGRIRYRYYDHHSDKRKAEVAWPDGTSILVATDYDERDRVIVERAACQRLGGEPVRP